jgi:hypothetical protein
MSLAVEEWSPALALCQGKGKNDYDVFFGERTRKKQ